MGAQRLLEDTLKAAPGWVDGHRILAVQRITGGDEAGFDRSYAAAVKSEPQNAALWMGWFQLHAQRKDWDRNAVLADLHSEARSMSTAKRPVREWE